MARLARIDSQIRVAKTFARYRGHLGPSGQKLQIEFENGLPGPPGPGAQKVQNGVERESKQQFFTICSDLLLNFPLKIVVSKCPPQCFTIAVANLLRIVNLLSVVFLVREGPLGCRTTRVALSLVSQQISSKCWGFSGVAALSRYTLNPKRPCP